VTVHRNKFLFNKTNHVHKFPKFNFVKKLYMFRAFPLPIIWSFLLYIRHIKFGKFVRLVGFIKKKLMTFITHNFIQRRGCRYKCLLQAMLQIPLLSESRGHCTHVNMNSLSEPCTSTTICRANT